MTWTREAILAAVADWIAIHGQPPTSSEWQKAHDGYPTYTAIRRHFAGWPELLEAAGYAYDDGRYIAAPETKEKALEAEVDKVVVLAKELAEADAEYGRAFDVFEAAQERFEMATSALRAEIDNVAGPQEAA